ncbi:MAG: hypothetical protein AB7F35_13245 [Acetobacteraceae bacterium]
MNYNNAGLTSAHSDTCAEVVMSRRLAALASDAITEGFPFVAEHLKHLALFILDEAAFASALRQTTKDG